MLIPRRHNRRLLEVQDRPGGPWFPWYRYQVQTNFIDGRLTLGARLLAHQVQVMKVRVTGYSWPIGASRVSDRLEF